LAIIEKVSLDEKIRIEEHTPHKVHSISKRSDVQIRI
jgi:hypothetical protein